VGEVVTDSLTGVVARQEIAANRLALELSAQRRDVVDLLP
jgi:hypothetical protein